eukprot:jgi/Tetstr1/454022/TSEL_040941.t1
MSGPGRATIKRDETAVLLSRLFKWDHVTTDGNPAALGNDWQSSHVMGNMKIINDQEPNLAIRDHKETVFDLILDRMIETYAMYVYCPSAGIAPSINALNKSRASLRTAVLEELANGVRESSNRNGVHQVVVSFAREATKILSTAMKARVSAVFDAREQDIIYRYDQPELEASLNSMFEATRVLAKFESFRFSRTHDGKDGVQKNLADEGQAASRGGVENIDDVLSRNAKLRKENYPSKSACASRAAVAATEALLQRDDFGIACNLNGRKIPKGRVDEVADVLARPREEASATGRRPGTARIEEWHTNTLYKAHALLLDQARLRLSHASMEYSTKNKFRLEKDDTMSEAYVRFYDKHLTDFVRSVLSDSPVHAFFLGAVVSQVHFRIMREKCDDFIRSKCAERGPAEVPAGKQRPGKPSGINGPAEWRRGGAGGPGEVCSPLLHIKLDTNSEQYSKLYSDEIRMFHLTTRPFVDQFVSVYNRLDRNTSFILNNIPNDGLLTSSKKHEVKFLKANIALARKLFHKMHGDQRLMFDLIRRIKTDTQC